MLVLFDKLCSQLFHHQRWGVRCFRGQERHRALYLFQYSLHERR
jgi:hypothetical protein